MTVIPAVTAAALHGGKAWNTDRPLLKNFKPRFFDPIQQQAAMYP
jgi:hypothetical protein